MTTAKKPASLAERLVRARGISNEINAATDDLNAELEALQRKFAALRLGVEAHVSLSTSNEEEAHDYFRDLWFEKVSADWLFTIRSGQDFEDAPIHTTPLLKASKALRLEGAHRMPELLEALIQKAEKQVEEIERATTVVKDLGDVVDRVNGATAPQVGVAIPVPPAGVDESQQVPPEVADEKRTPRVATRGPQGGAK